jgi:predicted metal-dependent RNase
VKTGHSLRLKILGGCREQGRSSFLVEADGGSWLFDCGVKRAVVGATVGEYPLLDEIDCGRLDGVILSHAHEDHVAALPLLYKRGYGGSVWCTGPTARLAAEYCRSWLKNVERHRAPLPYAIGDIDRIRFETRGYGEPIDLGIRVEFVPAGHLVGSALCRVEWEGRRFAYTGDQAYEGRVLPDPAPAGEAETLIVDGTYGKRRVGRDESEGELLALIERTAASRGSVLLPLPRYGRSQELLVLLYERRSELPPIYVEDNLREASENYLGFREWLRPEGARLLAEALGSGAFRYVASAEQRRDAMCDAPALILATDAMLSSGASLEYLRGLAPEPRNLVILTGHSAEGTTGARLLSGERDVGTVAEPLTARLGIASVSIKVHPDMGENLALASSAAERAVIVHSEGRVADELAAQYRARGIDASAPEVGSTVELFRR